MKAYLSSSLIALAFTTHAAIAIPKKEVKPPIEKVMFVMNYEVQIGTKKLIGIESITIDSSADSLSDQCTITLPGMAYNKGLDLESKVKRGDTITVKLGYDGDLRTEFTGYLKSIHPNSPMKLECEDSIYLFRKSITDKQFKSTTVKTILQYVVDQINPQLKGEKMKLVSDISGFEFDKFTIVRSNGYETLEKLKSETGLAIYCRGHELHCHLAYTQKTGDVTYDFARNLEESSDLEYVRKEDVKFQIKIVGRTKKGANVDVEVGEKGGDTLTIQRPAISNKATLEAIAKEQLKKRAYDGYRGSIKGWLIPDCEIGYTVKLVDKEYPEREGRYYAKSVKTEFSKEGGRRTVTLGMKLSA